MQVWDAFATFSVNYCPSPLPELRVGRIGWNEFVTPQSVVSVTSGASLFIVPRIVSASDSSWIDVVALIVADGCK